MAGREFKHGQVPRTGVLLMNLGTPQAPTAAAVRRYLREFLSDRRVIDLPRMLWLPILYGPISLLRPSKVAKNYQKVWLEDGSPLLVHSQAIAASVSQAFEKKEVKVPIELAMSYGQPSIGQALERFAEHDVRRLLLLPLYPQYSATTTAAALDGLMAQLKARPWLPELRVVNDYFDHPGYIGALADSIRDYQVENGQPDRLLLSFHGLPERYWHAGDPYPCQCQATARLVAERLGLDGDAYHVAFQSRFGKAKWIEPYTDKTLQQWGAQGIKRVQVVCPGFAADCLETLEEIQIQNRELFIEAGGLDLEYIPALNAQSRHIDALADIIEANCAGWPEFTDRSDVQRAEDEASASADRAKRAGAPA